MRHARTRRGAATGPNDGDRGSQKVLGGQMLCRPHQEPRICPGFTSPDPPQYRPDIGAGL